MTALEAFLIGEPDLDDVDTLDESHPETLEQADWHIRKLARLRRHMAENEAIAHAEIQRIRMWLEEENAKLQRQAAFYEQNLAQFHRALLETDPKRKTVSLPAGALRARKHPDRVEILDADMFITWADAAGRSEFVRTKVEPVKSEIKRLLSTTDIELEHGLVLSDPTTGEAVPGVVWIEGETSFTVDAARGPEEVSA
ncbi:MAG: host-nuclease inhibitor Gam family protein [Actinomycetota bacterium]|nr:host-nuclease inhibitor Gam family protein [Actinomycetota bacterium]